MISFGKNIKSVDDPLGKVPVKTVFDSIRNPKPHITSLLSQLRVVRQLDPSQYTKIKAQLPYIVCAMFDPPARRTENFAYTQYFIIDIDHISAKGIVLEDIRKKLENDPRTMLCFTSPGGDGLKIMMKLSERCHDAGLYKTFYKMFVIKFSRQYGLDQIVDTRTCDVARACFISADSHAFFNPNPESIDISTYINPDENPLQAFDIKHEVDKAAKEGDKMLEKKCSSEPENNILRTIRETLDPRIKNKTEKKAAYVPPELKDIMNELCEYITGKGINVDETIGIQYGQKLRCHIAVMKAEVNIFYGKHGFSVLISPRTGTDNDANNLLVDTVKSFLISKGYI